MNSKALARSVFKSNTLSFEQTKRNDRARKDANFLLYELDFLYHSSHTSNRFLTTPVRYQTN